MHRGPSALGIFQRWGWVGRQAGTAALSGASAAGIARCRAALRGVTLSRTVDAYGCSCSGFMRLCGQSYSWGPCTAVTHGSAVCMLPFASMRGLLKRPARAPVDFIVAWEGIIVIIVIMRDARARVGTAWLLHVYVPS